MHTEQQRARALRVYVFSVLRHPIITNAPARRDAHGHWWPTKTAGVLLTQGFGRARSKASAATRAHQVVEGPAWLIVAVTPQALVVEQVSRGLCHCQHAVFLQGMGWVGRISCSAPGLRDRNVCTLVAGRVQFSNQCGVVYKGGNVVFSADGNALLSPVGNRVTVFDLVEYVTPHATPHAKCRA